ncbi:MAG: hypothetical protein IJ557_02520 [Bacteroidaceae bacterium]|nr:hypothetical protein [Bacteroidaceae bacterium]
MFRKPKYTEQPRVFIHLERNEDDSRIVRLWIRNSPGRWCERMAEGLKNLGMVTRVHGRRCHDLIWREHYYYHYWLVELRGVGEGVSDHHLRMAVQSQFRMMQDCRVEWVGKSKILNLRIWHRSEARKTT